MRKRKSRRNTGKNKAVAIILMFLAWIAAQLTTDLTASVFIIMFFVLPLMLAKENVIY